MSASDPIRCMYCLEEASRAASPRQLPCRNIACLMCLENSAPTPCICGVTHAIRSLSPLQTYPKKRTQTEPTPDIPDTKRARSTGRVKCDKCTEEAECFCTDCVKKLCAKHIQIHKSFFSDQLDDSDTHDVITISEYAQRPEYFAKPKCQQHGEILSVCCKKCYTMKCSQCRMDDKCTTMSSHFTSQASKASTSSNLFANPVAMSSNFTSLAHEAATSSNLFAGTSTTNTCFGQSSSSTLFNDERDHVFATIKGTEIALQAEFEGLVKTCSGQITELCRREKSTWQELDVVEEEFSKISAKVSAKTQRLVQQMIAQGEEVAHRIERSRRRKQHTVERRLSQIRNYREKYEGNIGAYHRFVTGHHVTKLISERENLRKSLEMDITSLAQPDLSIRPLKDVADRYLKLDFSSHLFHNVLEHAHTLDLSTFGQCESLALSGDDTLLALFKGRIMICWSIAQSVELEVLYEGPVRAMACKGTLLYFLHKGETTNTKSIRVIDLQVKPLDKERIVCVFDNKTAMPAGATSSSSTFGAGGSGGAIQSPNPMSKMIAPPRFSYHAPQLQPQHQPQLQLQQQNPAFDMNLGHGSAQKSTDHRLIVTNTYMIAICGDRIHACHIDGGKQCHAQFSSKREFCVTTLGDSRLLVVSRDVYGNTQTTDYYIADEAGSLRIVERHPSFNAPRDITDVCRFNDRVLLLLGRNYSLSLTTLHGKVLKELPAHSRLRGCSRIYISEDTLATTNYSYNMNTVDIFHLL